MADTVTRTKTGKMSVLFVDGDTRIINVKNPRNDITESEIASLNAYMQENNVIIGDRYSGTFGKITEFKVVTKEQTKLDI